MSVMLSKQLYGQLLVQIYSELKKSLDLQDTRVENIYPYKNHLQRTIVT